jgi:hypothetical protein
MIYGLAQDLKRIPKDVGVKPGKNAMIRINH